MQRLSCEGLATNFVTCDNDHMAYESSVTTLCKLYAMSSIHIGQNLIFSIYCYINISKNNYRIHKCTRQFKYDRDLCGLFTHKSVPVIFEPPCTYTVYVEGITRSYSINFYGNIISDLHSLHQKHIQGVKEGLQYFLRKFPGRTQGNHVNISQNDHHLFRVSIRTPFYSRTATPFISDLHSLLQKHIQGVKEGLLHFLTEFHGRTQGNHVNVSQNDHHLLRVSIRASFYSRTATPFISDLHSLLQKHIQGVKEGLLHFLRKFHGRTQGIHVNISQNDLHLLRVSIRTPLYSTTATPFRSVQ